MEQENPFQGWPKTALIEGGKNRIIAERLEYYNDTLFNGLYEN